MTEDYGPECKKVIRERCQQCGKEYTITVYLTDKLIDGPKCILERHIEIVAKQEREFVLQEHAKACYANSTTHA